MTKTYELTPRYERCASYYGKARIEETPTHITLISYKTPMLKLNKETAELTFLCSSEWAYSQTTNRHINEFLRQFTNEKAKSKGEILKMAGIR